MNAENVEDAEPGERVPRGRSPSYPGITLEDAVQRARVLYDYAQQHPVPLAKITSLWGYKSPTTGTASVAYAALKKYGLLDEEGRGSDRVGQLSELAVEVLHPNPHREEALQRAALNPGIHREWWETYGSDLPPEDTLHWKYVVRGPFTEKGFKEFLRVYRETVTFARLDASVAAGGAKAAAPEAPASSEAPEPPATSSAAGVQQAAAVQGADTPSEYMSYPIPVAAGVNVVVQGPFPLTDPEWEQFLAVLSAMKPALTRPVKETRGRGVPPEAPE